MLPRDSKVAEADVVVIMLESRGKRGAVGDGDGVGAMVGGREAKMGPLPASLIPGPRTRVKKNQDSTSALLLGR